jgi:hypothetical protein
MKPFLRRALMLATAVGPGVLGSPGCADSESIIFIRQVQARLASGSSGCTVDNSPSSPFLPGGTLDIAFRHEYKADLLVGNQLVPRGNSSQLRTETARVAIQGAVVRLQDASGAVVWGPVTVPGSGFIDPASGSNPSYGVTETILLGAQFGAALAGQVGTGTVRHFVSVVKVFGRTLGGMAVESGEWQYPIDVCNGCLVAFPTEATDPNVMPTPNCDLAAGTGTSVTPPCDVGQDDTVDCRVCKQFFPGSAICEPNGVVTTPMPAIDAGLDAATD